MKQSTLAIFILALSLFLNIENSFVEAAEKKSPLKITVSILPQEYFVKRIGESRVDVATLVQPGHSPATYAPTPRQMAAIAAANIYFRIGVPFENTLVPKLTRSSPHLTIVDLRKDINLMRLEEPHEGDHEHNDELDPHTWLDPMLALKQSRLIRDTLIHFDPAGKHVYTANFTALEKDLKLLDLHLRKVLHPLAGNTIYVFHPAYGYLCRAYNLKQQAINPDGKNPGARYLARLIEQAKRNQVKVIFVQPQFSEKAARTIAESIQGSVIALDPLAPDYLANMRSIADRLIASQSGHTQ